MEIVRIQQWISTFSRMENRMSCVEIMFSILGLLVIIPYMEFCFPKVGIFSETLAGKL